MAVLVCGSVAIGATRKAETDPAKLLEVKVLVKELEFTAEQQKDLKKIVENLGKAITRWDAENREEYAEIQREYLAALRSDSSSKMRQALADRKALDRRRQYMVDSHMRHVGRLFTPEQKAAWEGHKLHVEMFARYKRWQLSGKQVQQLKDSCHAIGGMIAERRKRADVVGMMRIRTALQQHIVASIFTEAQRKKIEAPEPGSKEEREAAAKRKADAKIAFQGYVTGKEVEQAFRSLKVTQEMADLMVAHNIRMAEEARRNFGRIKRRTIGGGGKGGRKKKRR